MFHYCTSILIIKLCDIPLITPGAHTYDTLSPPPPLNFQNKNNHQLIRRWAKIYKNWTLDIANWNRKFHFLVHPNTSTNLTVLILEQHFISIRWRWKKSFDHAYVMFSSFISYIISKVFPWSLTVSIFKMSVGHLHANIL